MTRPKFSMAFGSKKIAGKFEQNYLYTSKSLVKDG